MNFFSLSQVESNVAIPKKLAHDAIIQSTPPRQFFTLNEFDSYLSLIKCTDAHAYIYIRRRNQSVAHKSGRQFSRMDVRGIRTGTQDDVEDVYILYGREIKNFGMRSCELSFVRVKSSSGGDTLNTATTRCCSGTLS